MGIVTNILKLFVGDKSEKDVKSLRPLVEAIHKAEMELASLSPDQLRMRSADFKKQIKDANSELAKEVAVLKEQIDSTEDIDLRESLY